MGKNGLKLLGILATILGFGVTLFSNYVEDKQLEAMVDEKVQEALDKHSEEENEKDEEEES